MKIVPAHLQALQASDRRGVGGRHKRGCFEDAPGVCEAVLRFLEECAANGWRAPTTKEIRAGSAIFARLADRGDIRVEVYGKNWRVIQILRGKHAGARTMEPPFAHTGPYKVFDQGRPYSYTQDRARAGRYRETAA